ncbi:multiubiquitin domain-containing protein [Cryobacterium glaciale]|uniref:multiubiquitin domain-containing protein n=1 Tax=Cryobacterium glaciale TaxID=1259145 RepID=UPI00141AF36D|nr:multiubiquitin domain-containing protein [Cryobacterium glaciale]
MIEVDGPGARKPERLNEIVVNGELTAHAAHTITFEELVQIAFPEAPAPDATFTVTFRNAQGRRREGELVDGQSVNIKKKGTTFDVTTTGKS